MPIRSRRLPGILTSALLLTTLAVANLRCDRASPAGGASGPHPFTDAQARIVAGLMPDPGIINTHEHLMDHRQALAKLAEVNRRVGIASTVLVGSSRYTFYLDESGFVDHHRNNDYLCRLAREKPGEYYAWVTFDPLEDDLPDKLDHYLRAGASGVKLYAGHGGQLGDKQPFHACALDHPNLLALYDYCERNRVPICLHINMRKFADEAYRVLDRYPKLPIIVPHCALWNGKLPLLDKLLTRYPSMLTDLSFGWWYSVDAFQRFDRDPQTHRDFIIKHQDRFLWGTDVVITASEAKSRDENSTTA